LKNSGSIVISARLAGRAEQNDTIAMKMTDLLQVRKSQPTGPSAGSVFKNPENDFAGRLIEACGLKGLQIGMAQISATHANFIINKGGATADDVKKLIDKARSEVQKQFDIELQEEIRYLGEW
jgi:UDP-N-acetylmuramate dehydrogenase